MSSAFLGSFFLGSIDLERVLGYSPMELGLAFLPVAIVMALFSIRFSAQLIGRFGPGAMLGAGQLVALVALEIVAFRPTVPSYAIHFLLTFSLLRPGARLRFHCRTQHS